MYQKVLNRVSELHASTIPNKKTLMDEMLVNLIYKLCNTRENLQTLGVVYEFLSNIEGGGIHQEMIVHFLRENVEHFSKDPAFYDLDPGIIMGIFEKNKYFGDEMLRCKTLIKYAVKDSQKKERDQKLKMPQIKSNNFQWLCMTIEERQKRLNYFSCIEWVKLTFWEQKEVITDLKKFIHKDDIHIYTKAKNPRLIVNRDSKCKEMFVHIVHVSKSKKDLKTKEFKFINYQGFKGIQKNSGKTKQKVVQKITYEFPEWCQTPIEDSLGLDFSFEEFSNFHHESNAIPLFSDELFDEEFFISSLL